MLPISGRTRGENRAVSSVVGIALIVTVLVILAAVGVFVFDIGGLADSGPSTSFESEERVVYAESTAAFSSNTMTEANLTSVDITHAGGGALDISQTNIAVDGAGVVLGFDDDDLEDSSTDRVRLQPDIAQTAGSEEAVEFGEGDTWNVVGYAGTSSSWSREDAQEELTLDGDTAGWVHYPKISEDPGVPCMSIMKQEIPNGGASGSDKASIAASNWEHQCMSFDGGGRDHPALLQQGDQISVVWTASSGGKSQTLYQYSVQTESPVAS